MDKEEKTPAHINALPFETVGQVLQKLSIVDRFSCERVSPRWKAITWDLGWTEQKKLSAEIIFEGAKISQKEKFDTESFAVLFRRVGCNLIELVLGCFSPRTFADVFQWLKLLPNLAHLNIQGFILREAVNFLPDTLTELHSTGPFDEESLTALSAKCPSLESVLFLDSHPVKKIPVSAMNKFFRKYPGLKTLDFRWDFIKGEPNVSLTSIGQLHELRELYLTKVSVFDDAALTAVATGCPQLRRFTIEGVGVSEEAIRQLDDHPTLLDFELKRHPFLDGNTQKGIKGRWKTKKYKMLCSRISTDSSVLHEALKEITAIRKLLSHNLISNCAHIIDDLIKWGFLPLLVNSLRSTNAELQFNAVCALTNIAAGCNSSGQTSAVVEAGAVPELLKLLGLEMENVGEQSLWVLGNIIGDRSEFRDLCVQLGIIDRMVKMVETEKSINILRYVVWICANICKWKDPPPPMDIVQAFLPLLGKLIRNKDTTILNGSICAISYIADGGNKQIQCVIDSGIVPRLLSLLVHPEEKVQSPALRVVGNIATGTDEQTQLLLDLGVLKMIPALLLHRNINIVKDTIWFLSNVAAGGEHQLQALMDTGLVPVIIQFLVRPQEAQKEAVWAISNIAFRGHSTHVHYLVDNWVIPPLCNLLDDNDLCADTLKGLKNILKKTSTRTEEVCEKIRCYGGLDKIKNLRTHESESVKNVAKEIVDGFFSLDNEN